MQIRIVNTSKHPLPKYQTSGSAGMDLHAAIKEKQVIKPGERVLIPTGIHLELPMGYEAQIRPRSGLALKHGISLVNTPATIDSDYRGEVHALLINHGDEDFTIEDGDRIAQMIIAKHETITWDEVADLDSTTERGKKGFGHTGNKHPKK